jgi:hypothetical protein
MEGERDLVASHRFPTLAEKFHDKQYRHGYVAAHTRGVLARQMRNFRGELSQADFAAKIGKQKTVVGRLENPGYGGWSLRTMLEIAREEDVAVLARFVDFPTFLGFTDDMSDEAFCPRAYHSIETDEFASFAVQVNNVQSTSISYYDMGYLLGSPAASVPWDAAMGQSAYGAMGQSAYGDIFFGQQTPSLQISQQVAVNALTLPLSGLYLSGLYAPPLFQPAQSNTGMHELVRQRNKEIFELRNQVSSLSAELDKIGSSQVTGVDFSDHLTQPQRQRGIIPFPRAA